MICNSFHYSFPSWDLCDLYWVRPKYHLLWWASVSNLIYRQKIRCNIGHIENIYELSMLDFNGTSPCCSNLGIITHMNRRFSCEVESGEGIFGGNHVVWCSRINQVGYRPREDSFQDMEPLMIIYQLSNIIIIFSLWKINMVLLEESWQLIDLHLHALVFKMKTPHIIRTLCLFKLFIILGAQSSFGRLMTLFRLRIRWFRFLSSPYAFL